MYPAASSDVVAPAAAHQGETYTRRRRGHALPISTRQSILEWVALFLVAFPALVGTWLFGSVRLWSVGPQVIFSLLALLFLVARRVLYPQSTPLQAPPGGYFLLAFIGYAFIRSIGSTVPHDARIVAYTLCSYAIAYWVWTSLAGHQGRWRWCVGAMMLSVTIMAWYSLVQHGQESRGVLNTRLTFVPLTLPVVDTNGAGDSFVAAFLQAWLDDAGLDTAMRRGAIAGAFACASPGTHERFINREELHGLYQACTSL